MPAPRLQLATTQAIMHQVRHGHPTVLNDIYPVLCDTICSHYESGAFVISPSGYTLELRGHEGIKGLKGGLLVVPITDQVCQPSALHGVLVALSSRTAHSPESTYLRNKNEQMSAFVHLISCSPRIRKAEVGWYLDPR